MKKINYIIPVILLFTFLQGCYKDKGNYDYNAIASIVIDTTGGGFQSQYAVYRYDTLKLNPKVYLNGTLITDERQVADKVSFTWVIFQGTVGSAISSRDTLSHSVQLNAPVTKGAGRWIVHLTVKELATQVETYQRFTVDVSEVLSDGWMVFYERDGKTDVGVIVDDRSKKGVLQARLFLDLVKNTNGESLEGKPVGLVHSIGPLSGAEVLIASEQDYIAVDKSSFGKLLGFEDIFWTPPAKKAMQAVVGNYLRKELVINDNKVHSVNFSSSGSYRTNKLGPAMNGTYGQLASWAPSYYGSSYDAVVYDKTNKKFMYVPVNGTTVTDFPAQVNTVQYNPANVGLDLKASDWGLTNYEYSIMGDNTNTYLLISNFAGTLTNVGLRKISMAGSPDAASASTVASAIAGQYILYGAGANVYLFKYNSGAAAELAWSAPAGETVTCVRLQKFYYPVFASTGTLPFPNQVVYIATWNESAKAGKVYSYTIDASNGSISKTSERITGGYGKIKDMSYKWNL